MSNYKFKGIKGPYEYDRHGTFIWAPSEKGGKTPVGEVRGWGYLTGNGSGALGLDSEAAEKIQDATGELLAASWDLLELVMDAVEDENEFETEWNKQARAAIAKALGEAQ